MDIMEAIFSRRSIRQYTNEKVSDEDIKKILAAGMAAPSAFNAQPWRFIVIDNTKNNIREKIKEISPYAQMIDDSPASILVCGKTDHEIVGDYWPIDCSACIENMLLAIHGLGLGGVWTGIYPEMERVENFGKLFNLPENIKAHSLIIFGYPDEKKAKKDTYDEDIVFYDTWGKN